MTLMEPLPQKSQKLISRKVSLEFLITSHYCVVNCFNLFFRQIVQENSVWSALNFFYVAIMFHIYHIWKVEHKTIKDSGYVLKGTVAGHST